MIILTAAPLSRRRSPPDNISSPWRFHARSILITGPNGVHIKAGGANSSYCQHGPGHIKSLCGFARLEIHRTYRRLA